MSVQPLRRSESRPSSSLGAIAPQTIASGVKLVTEFEDFVTLRAPWNALAAASRSAGLFLSHDWHCAAWQWRQQTARLWLLCFYQSGNLAAVLPLVLEDNGKRGMRVRELSPLTVPDTQWCDLIVAERDSSVATEAFADALARRQGEWDVLRLKYLAPGAVLSSAFRDALARRGFATRLQPDGGNPFVPLDTAWETYYATRSRSLKKANNLAANRLAKAGTVRIEWLAPGTGDSAEVDRFLDRAIAISSRSWKTRTGNSLDNPGPQAFIRGLSHAAHERGWLSIWILSLSDRPLAMEYQLVADGRVYALRSDFDAEFEEISPGTHLNRTLLQQLFGRGLQRYYMGPGENPYKHRWTEQVEPVQAVTAYGRTMTGRWLAAWETTLKPLARSVRDRFTGSSSSYSERKPDDD
jgi:CelD/BcsL family acetyltransferase involved in cellulose biosynthesis